MSIKAFFDCRIVTFYPNIVNVGAWNVNLMAIIWLGIIDTFNTIDISADGYVTKQGWGDNFGTSLQHQECFAQIINLFDENILIRFHMMICLKIMTLLNSNIQVF